MAIRPDVRTDANSDSTTRLILPLTVAMVKYSDFFEIRYRRRGDLHHRQWTGYFEWEFPYRCDWHPGIGRLFQNRLFPDQRRKEWY